MKYEILSYNRNTCSIAVKFTTENFSDGLIYNVDIPLDENNKLITGDTLDKFIMSFAPHGQINRIIKCASVENHNEIEALVTPNQLIDGEVVL